jgi:hypothetical protein
MNRSTLRSFGIVIATAVIALSFSPLGANAQTLPVTDQPADAKAAAPALAQDVIFTDTNDGGMPVDVSVFKGRSNISLVELAGGKVTATTGGQSELDAQLFGNDGCD